MSLVVGAFEKVKKIGKNGTNTRIKNNFFSIECRQRMTSGNGSQSFHFSTKNTTKNNKQFIFFCY
jgi:hypothetical protein